MVSKARVVKYSRMINNIFDAEIFLLINIYIYEEIIKNILFRIYIGNYRL